MILLLFIYSLIAREWEPEQQIASITDIDAVEVAVGPDQTMYVLWAENGKELAIRKRVPHGAWEPKQTLTTVPASVYCLDFHPHTNGAYHLVWKEGSTLYTTDETSSKTALTSQAHLFFDSKFVSSDLGCVAWQAIDGTYAAIYDHGWHPPQRVAGNSLNAKLAATPSGKIILATSENFTVQLKSYEGGLWSFSREIYYSGTEPSKLLIEGDNNDNVHMLLVIDDLLFHTQVELVNINTAITPLCDFNPATNPSMAISQGQCVAAWMGSTGVHLATTPTPTSWSPQIDIPGVYPQLDASDFGESFVICTNGEGCIEILERTTGNEWQQSALFGSGILPKIKVAAGGSAVAAWSDGNKIYSTYSEHHIDPPASISGAIMYNQFDSQTECIHCLHWDKVPGAAEYRVYRRSVSDANLIKTIKENNYAVRGNETDPAGTYAITTVDLLGNESAGHIFHLD